MGWYVVKKGCTLMEAVEKAQKEMRGSWGIAGSHSLDDVVVCALTFLSLHFAVLDRQHPEELVAAAHGKWQSRTCARRD